MTATRLNEMTFRRLVSDELFERKGSKVPRREWHRARSLPAVGMPPDRRRSRMATALSVLVHVFLIWLLVRPPALDNLNPDLVEMEKGGGGAGPAGGGGGGTRGTGGVKYVQAAPPPTPATPPPQVVVPPVQPVIQPPKPVLTDPVMPTLELPKLLTTDPKAEVKVESPIIGTGGGTGTDGTRGNGPGTGGGVGTGVGTGRGSGVGPGTGGGNLPYYPCTNIELMIPPLPAPGNVRGFKLIANFDVDEKGKVLKVQFTPTRNGDYNRKLNDVLRSLRFRAGSSLEGVPMRTTCQITYEF
jgi:protein TonB